MRFALLLAVALAPLGARSYLTFSTYVGGNGIDIARAVATDGEGNVYVAGETASGNFPVTPGAWRERHGGTPGSVYSGFTGSPVADGFVTKFDATGKVVYSTFLGGAAVIRAIAVDGEGNAYVAGNADTAKFPATEGTLAGSGKKGRHGFVAKLNRVGSELVWATLLGGANEDDVVSIRVDEAGQVYATGTTRSADFPVTEGALQTTAGARPFTTYGFVVKLNASGTGLVYGTYLAGSAGATPVALALAAGGEVFVTGTTESTDFPVTAGAYQAASSERVSGFVSRLNAAGSGLVYSTYLGPVAAKAIAVDGTGAAFVVGESGGAYLAKLNAGGTEMIYSTLLGGASQSAAAGVAVDAEGNAWVTGTTWFAKFPVTGDAYQGVGYGDAVCLSTVVAPFTPVATKLNCGDSFLTKVDAAGAAILYSTYFGANGPEAGMALALAPGGGVYVAGSTQSANLPATAGALGTHRSAGDDCLFQGSPSASSRVPCEDGFVARFDVGSGERFGVVNGASFLPGAVAPGEVIAVVGAGGTGVTFDGVATEVLYAGEKQVNVVVPGGLRGKVTMTVAPDGPSVPVEIEEVAPGVITADSSGGGQAVVYLEDGSLNGPERPAAVGSLVSLYVTGIGSTGVGVLVGGARAEVVSVGELAAGVREVRFRVPKGNGGAVFVMAGHTVSSQSGVWMSVE